MNKTNDFLAHYGVPGMKWGVRRGTLSGKIKPRATLSYIDRAEQKWVDRSATKIYAGVYRRSQFRIRKGTRDLNNIPKYKNKDFKKDSPLRREYYKAYSDMVTKELNSTVGRRKILNPLMRVGQSPLRQFELHFEFDVNKELRPKASIRKADTLTGRKANRTADKARQVAEKIKHSAEASDELEVTLVYNDMGAIIDMTIPEAMMAQSMEDSTDAYLAHWGVLGMRWGVRRGGSKSSSVKVSRKAAKSKLSDIDDKELQDRVKRLQLEQQYAQLTQKKLSTGKQIVKDILINSAKQTATTYVTKYMTQGVESALKAAVKP